MLKEPPNSRVLFIGLNYHEYTSAIINEIENQFQYEVDYIDIQPRAIFFKVIKTLSPKIYKIYLNLHHKFSIKKHKGKKYKYILFLQCHQISDQNLSKLRSSFKNSKFILYNWDSVETHNYLDKVNFFNKIATFDPKDAKANRFQYLPLFCKRDIQEFSVSTDEKKSIFMIGNIVNPKRLEEVNKFDRICKKNNIIFKKYLKISPVVMVKCLSKKLNISNLKFIDANKKKIKQLYENSSVVFDYANHKQSGLTMRACEALGSGKQLVTNCKTLQGSKYEKSGQVYVYENFVDENFLKSFLKNGFDCSIKNTEFNIQNFIKKLFEEL